MNDILKNKIKMLDDFYINPKEYIIEKIDIDEITLDTLKYENNFALQINKELNNFNIKFLSKNDYYYFKTDSLLIKISFYLQKERDTDNLISYVLSSLVLKGLTNRILLPVCNYDIESSLLPKSIYDEIKINDLCCCKIRYNSNNMYLLKDYIKKYDINYKKLLLQVIETLQTIHKIYPNFRHNKLDIDSIFCFVKNKEFDIKITNFEKASLEYDIIISEELYDEDKDIEDILQDNKDSDEDPLHDVKNINNNDLLFFCKSLLKNFGDKINLETKNFISKLRDMKNNLNFLFEDNKSEYALTGIRKINKNKKNITLNRKLLMFGGSRVKLPYQNEENSPFVTNDEKAIVERRKNEEATFSKPTYDKSKPTYDKSKPTYDKSVYDISKGEDSYQPPAYIPMYNPTGVKEGYLNIQNPIYKEPIQKIVNVNLGGPLSDFTTISRIFEDNIPDDPKTMTFQTIYERIVSTKYIRSLIIDINDGEEMHIKSSSNSFLSRFKILDVNPFSIDANPYKDMGKNFLITKCAYPIRYDNDRNGIKISKGASGFCLRIYRLTIGEKDGDSINDNITKHRFDVWREIEYYRYMYYNIIEKKVSPNFISYIFHKKDPITQLRWDDLQRLQRNCSYVDNQVNTLHNVPDSFNKFNFLNNKNETELNVYYFDERNKFGDSWNNVVALKNRINKVTVQFIPVINRLIDPKLGELFEKKCSSQSNILFEVISNGTKEYRLYWEYDDRNNPFRWKDILLINRIYEILGLEREDLNNPSNTALIVLTESPTNNFITWCSPIYENRGSVQRNVATGYHNEDTWLNILFQMVYIFAVLQKNNIYFTEMELEKNFYIRDLNIDSANPSYWIYEIDNFSYYIPNKGYLLVFDSKYSNLSVDNIETISKNRILSDKLFERNNNKGKNNTGSYTKNEINEKIIEKFKEILNSNTFTIAVRKKGGLIPPQNVLAVIDTMNKTIDSSKDIKDFFKEYFKMFLNNKIGSDLSLLEKEGMDEYSTNRTFKNGQLVARCTGWQEYKWVLIKEYDSSNNIYTIIDKDNLTPGKYKEMKVNKFNLLPYPNFLGMLPNDINEQNILENYKFN